MTHFIRLTDTPLGKVVLASDGEKILALVWKESELARLGIGKALEAGSDLLDEAERQLREYFSGIRREFDLPLALRGTPFQQRVWSELRRIPFGKTWSYQELARRVGSPKAVRAVGSANGRNPVSIFVPCHRVVRLSGELGGYAGGLGNKAFLLDLEKRSLSLPKAEKSRM